MASTKWDRGSLLLLSFNSTGLISTSESVFHVASRSDRNVFGNTFDCVNPMWTVRRSMGSASLKNMSIFYVLTSDGTSRMFTKKKWTSTYRPPSWANPFLLLMTWSGMSETIQKNTLCLGQMQSLHLRGINDVRITFGPVPVSKWTNDTCNLIDLIMAQIWTLKLLFWILRLQPSCWSSILLHFYVRRKDGRDFRLW